MSQEEQLTGNRPPLVCFLKKINFAVVAAQLTGTGMTSFGNVEYPNGFSMNGNRGGGPPTILLSMMISTSPCNILGRFALTFEKRITREECFL